jgi:O-antigen/teichoic acid export membrane protein
MANVKYNIVANYLGQIWVGLIALVFIPLYIDYLGIEAYGLIALFAVMQSMFVLLDAGMTPTLNREMAKFNAGAYDAQFIRVLLHTFEMICYGLAFFVLILLWVSSSYFATQWLNVDYISTDTITNSVLIMAFIISLRLCEGIYRGSLYGLEKQVWYNLANGILATLRYVGALLVMIWISASIEAFFLWQALISLLTVLIFSIQVHRLLPKTTLPIKFSYAALIQNWKFTGGMMGITFLTMIFLQVDKVVLSRLLSLTDFGYYALAATAASVIYMIVVPATQAVYPRIVHLVSTKNFADLTELYHQLSQFIVVVISPAVMILCFFSDGVIFMWSGSAELSNHVAPLLSVLVIGTFMSSLSYIPYQIQVAEGNVGLLLRLNLIIVITFFTLIFILVPSYGAWAAAWLWIVANFSYLLVLAHFTHKNLLENEKWHWYFFDILLPLLGIVIVMLLVSLLAPLPYVSRLHWLIFLLFSSSISIVISGFLAKIIRLRIYSFLRNLRLNKH